jgi:anti-sigma-K factor RskA
MSAEQENHVIDLLPDYVLDVLTDEETCQVAEHLSICPTCQVELERLQQVADDLPLALVQTTPPSRVKDRLLASIHAQHNPASSPVQQTTWQKLASAFRTPLPALGLALIVILALGNLFLFRQLNLASQQSSTSMRVYALANTQDSPGAIGTMILDPNGKYGSLVVDSLANLDPGRQYQIWLTKGDERTSGGVFSVNNDGYASIEILSSLPLSQYDSIGITIEPVGGSPGPTGAKVLGGTLPH